MSRRERKFTGHTFVALYQWEMDCPAYRHLSVYGRALLMEFRKAYNGHNNGEIVMSVRQAANTAAKTIKELQGNGWIRQTQKGAFSQKSNKTASTWRITNQPVGAGVDVPETKEYIRWRPEGEIQNAVPSSGTVCPTTRDRERKSGPIKSYRAPLNCPTTSDREPSKTPSDGPTTSDTYISTIQGGET